MFLLNSRLGLFSAAGFHRHPFSRSYGVNLPSSLTTLLPLALGFSPHLPVSVCGTGTLDIHKPFLAFVQTHFPTKFRSLSPWSTIPRVPLSPSVPLLKVRWLRILYRMCIDYASRPRLSFRLTQGGRTFPWKPQIFGHYDSHIILATYSGILTPIQSTCAPAHASPRMRRSPTPRIAAQPKLRLHV